MDPEIKAWTSFSLLDMGASLNGGTPKTPQNDHFK